MLDKSELALTSNAIAKLLVIAYKWNKSDDDGLTQVFKSVGLPKYSNALRIGSNCAIRAKKILIAQRHGVDSLSAEAKKKITDYSDFVNCNNIQVSWLISILINLILSEHKSKYIIDARTNTLIFQK